MSNLSTHSFEAFHPALHDHDGEICPICEQVIPNDRLEQVKARQAQHQREVESQLALKLKAEREQLQQQNEQALAKAREEAAAKEAAARVEERRAATAEADVKIAVANNAAEAVRAQADALKKQLDASAADTNEKVTAARAEERRTATVEADAKIAAANTATEAVRAQANELKKQLDASATATTEKVSEAREAARKEAEATLQPQLAAALSAVQQAQEQARLVAAREDAARAQITQLTQDAAVAREEGKKAAGDELRTKLAQLDDEKQAAVAAKTAAEQQVQALQATQERALREGIQETRDALEKSHREAMNAEQAKHFEENQKAKSIADDLKRQLENKTAEELGEGAEVDLHEALKQAFPDDDITRVKHGAPGADIRHMVRHNGKDCGLILYDSKNHKAWRNEFVTKLRDDQIADKADYAILTTTAFPKGTRQVHVQDRVIVLNPARAVVIAEIVRQQVVQVHCLKLSNDDREQKSVDLYSFITSERFEALMTKLHTTTDSLSELEVKELAAHNKVWQKRGQLINSVVKAQADLMFEVGRIVGTAEDTVDDDLATMSTDIAATGAQ